MQKLVKIKSINGYRCFSPLVWDENDAEPFGQYNLIYGWNGSGKSTFGSFFHLLEKREGLSEGISFDMLFTDDAKRNMPFKTEQYSNMCHRFLVFHDTYIEDNIKKYNEIDRIFVVGKDQGKRVAELEKLNEAIRHSVDSLKALQTRYSGLNKAYDKYCRDHAAMIKQEAGLSAAFNKNAFISACQGEIQTISKEDYENAKKALKSEARSEITVYAPKDIARQKVNELIDSLAATPANQAIDALRRNAELERWVGNGLQFHRKAGERCKFCGSVMTQERLDELAGHFNQSYQLLTNKLKEEEEGFAQYIAELERYESRLPIAETLYHEYRSEYQQAIELLKGIIEAQIVFCRRIIEIIRDKKGNVISSTYAEEARQLFSSSVDLRTPYAAVEGIVKAHNERCANNEKYIRAARDSIRDYWVSQFRQEWKGKETEITSCSDECRKVEENLERMKADAEGISHQIRDSRIPAERINNDIAFLMGRREICFEEYENGYRITRNGVLVEHLSKGEENAVALIYFFNALEGDEIDKGETIVILDDPISSFDSNFYFNAISYIKGKIEGVGQVIILTHKFSLMNDYKNMFKDSSMKMYVMDRRSGKPVIRRLDSHLREYYDEYAYLFKQLYLFVKEPPRDMSTYLIYPNMARRVLESFLMFKVPRAGGSLIEKALELAGKDTSSVHAILRLTNDRSHLRVIPNSDYTDSTDEMESTPEFLKQLLVFIRENDPHHFDTLVRTFDKSYEGEETFKLDILKEGIPPKRTIKLFDCAVCAGDGFNPSDDQFAYENFATDNLEADYALRISGSSMEKDIPDGSIVLVKDVEELKHKDIGIFIWNGESMCKKYIVAGSQIMLVPNNKKFNKIIVEQPEDLIIQGKVIGVIEPDS